MITFRNKHRALAGQLAVELSELRTELEIERNRRVAAETLAEDRAQQIAQAYEFVKQANESRDAAVSERLKSLDLVNAALLSQHGPEKPPPDIKQFKAVPKDRLSAVVEARKHDREFMTGMLNRLNKKPVPPVQ